MADDKLNVGINFTTTGNAEAAAALNALGTAAGETAAQFDTAAISAKAMADAVTGARALAQLGIKASAPGVVNAEGSGLVTVAQEEQATAQSILNGLGLEAVAVTREQAAEVARLAEVSTAAAAAVSEQAAATSEGAVAAQRFAASELEAGTAGAEMRAETAGMAGAFGGLLPQLIAVVAALEAYNKAKEFIGAGVEFNATIESARLGIAATVNALATLSDAEGRALEGQEAFAGATKLADEQIQKLYADSARTSTTVQQLVTTFQSAVGPGLAAGASLDQIRRLTTDAALAAGALNIPYTQISVTLAELLSGHAQVRNRLTQALVINQADVKVWKEKHELVTQLLDRFSQYEPLAARIQDTWRGIVSNVKEFLQQFSGAATLGAFTTLETGIKGALGNVFDFNTGKLTSNIAGAADLMREGLGGAARLVVDLVESIVHGLENLGTWFKNNQVEAEQLGRDFIDMLESQGRILAGLGEIVAKTIAWAAESVAIQAVLRGIADVVGFAADHFKAIAAAVGVILGINAISSTLQALAFLTSTGGLTLGGALVALAGPITLAVAAIVALTAAVEYHRITQERATAAIVAAHQATIDHAASTATLVGRYEALSREIASGKLHHDALARAEAELKTVTEELIKVSPAYRDALTDETTKLGAKLAVIDKLYAAQLAQLDLQRDAARAEVTSLEAQRKTLEQQERDAIGAQGKATGEGGATIADAHLAQVTARLTAVRTQLHEAVIEAKTFGAAIFGAAEAKAKAEEDAQNNLTPKGGGGAGKDEKGLAGAEANAAIERMKAQTATITRELDSQLAHNEISYAEYFAKLNAIELTSLDVQIATKQKQLEQTKDPKEKIKLGADIDALHEQQTQIFQKNADKRAQLEAQYAKQGTALAIQAIKDRGEAELAFEVEWDEKHRAELARAVAEDDQVRIQQINREHDRDLAKLRADSASVTARGATSEADATVRGTQAAVEAGALSEAKGREIIIAAYRREAEAILAALAAAQELAKVSTTPENAAKVDQLAKQYATVQKAIVQTEDTSLHLRQEIAGALSRDLTEFFTRTIAQTHTLGDAFRSLAQSVIKSIEDIVAKLLEAQITSTLTHLLGLVGGLPIGDYSGAGGAGSLSTLANAGVPHSATGGHIRGAGSATSDSIPAMLSNGEYVVRASAVDHMGVDFFNAINDGAGMRPYSGGGIARFAEGGWVGQYAGGGAVGGSGGDGGGKLEITVNHHPDLILEVVRSPLGHKVIMEALARNPKSARSVLRLSGQP